MGIEAIYRRPNTSKPAPGHKIYPYLLRGLKVERPNQVWATDLTYIPMARGFVYLVAVVDWFSRSLAREIHEVGKCDVMDDIKDMLIPFNELQIFVLLRQLPMFW